MSKKLTNTGITLKEMIKKSLLAYKSKFADDKNIRSRLDIISGRVKFRRGLDYNSNTKQWEQISRDVRIDFIVKSKPISYKKTDSVNPHVYTITFLLHDWEKGFESTFKYRSGGIHKWKSSKKKISEGRNPAEKERIRQQNKKIQELNIKRGLDGSFIFTGQMFLAKHNNILFGPMTALNKAPKITNPKMLLYFDKHSFYIATRILPRLLNHKSFQERFI